MTTQIKTTAANISARKLAILSANVARHRKATGMSKTEFASYTTVGRDTIRRIETRPQGYVPSLESVQALAQLPLKKFSVLNLPSVQHLNK